MDKVINAFLTKADESLEKLDIELVSKYTPANDNLLSNVFIIINTIKKTKKCLDISILVASASKNILGRFYKKQLTTNHKIVFMNFEANEYKVESVNNNNKLIQRIAASFQDKNLNITIFINNKSLILVNNLLSKITDNRSILSKQLLIIKKLVD